MMTHPTNPFIPMVIIKNQPIGAEAMKDELLKLCPTLDFAKDDVNVFKMCMGDMQDYTDFLHENYVEVEPESQDVLHNGAVIGSVMDDDFSFSLGIPMYKNIADDIEGFTRMFTRLWWKKYQSRVKIVFELPPHATDANAPIDAPAFTPEETKDIIKSIRRKFMQCGEICCTQPMANNLLAVQIKNARRKEWQLQDKINLRTTLVRIAKEVSYSHGVLLFIKPNIKGTKSSMNEFRNDDAAKNM